MNEVLLYNLKIYDPQMTKVFWLLTKSSKNLTNIKIKYQKLLYITEAQLLSAITESNKDFRLFYFVFNQDMYLIAVSSWSLM